MAKQFEDTSKFQGWVQFESPEGEMRAQNRGGGMWGIYIKNDNAFIHSGIVRTKSKTPRGIYAAWEKLSAQD